MRVYVSLLWICCFAAVSDSKSTYDHWQDAVGPIDTTVLENRDFLHSDAHRENSFTGAVEPRRPAYDFKPGTSPQHEYCGMANEHEKIVGGSETSPHQFPWLVAIIGPELTFCTGSIISELHVLTSAYCVEYTNTYDVYIGAHDLSVPEEGRQVITSTKVHVHPGWSIFNEMLEDNLAIIELPQPIVFNNFARPACLPTEDDVDKDFAGETVTVTGWGKTSDSAHDVSNVLNYNKVEVITNEECRRAVSVSSGHICTDSTGGNGICRGDSGGPMNLLVSEGKYMQIGTASFTSKLGCESNGPDGFTRLTEYLDWIQSITEIRLTNKNY